MANLYVTGPVHVYVSIPPGLSGGISGSGVADPTAYPSTIYYLGTGEQPPAIDVSPVYSAVANDIAGDQIPFDEQYMGAVGQGVVTLSRWNEAVLNALPSSRSTAVSAGTGGDLITDRGSLMQFEGLTFHTWFHFPYATAKNFNLLYGMPAGYHFVSCKRLPWTVSPGTKAMRRLFAMSAMPTYVPSTGKFHLYDNVMTTIPAIPPTAATGLVT